eukprot:2794362-Heterocapsa_arctica.AAC.1
MNDPGPAPPLLSRGGASLDPPLGQELPGAETDVRRVRPRRGRGRGTQVASPAAPSVHGSPT